MTYTVWIDHGSEGWAPSDLLGTLEECIHYAHVNGYGHDYRITRDVEVSFVEKMAPREVGAGIRVSSSGDGFQKYEETPVTDKDWITHERTRQ